MSRVYLVLLGGIVAVSFAAILIRWAEAPAIVIAGYRLGLASLILLPFAANRWPRELTNLPRQDLGYLFLSGIFLSLHFAFWISSLFYTSVASSVVLVTTSPLFVGVISHLSGRDRLSREIAIGIILAVLGGMAIGWGDLSLKGHALFGDLLAIVGAMAVTGYILAGRRLRQRLSNLTYVSTVYSIAAVVTFILVLFRGEPLPGYSPQTYLLFLLLALGPQILGHSAFNWALGRVPAPLVSAATLGEAVGATILAFFLLGEVPTPLKILGGVLILLGVFTASRGVRDSREDKRRVAIARQVGK